MVVYETVDEVIASVLSNAAPVHVRVEINAERVRLFVGPRDWEWNRVTGALTGSGCFLA